MSAINTKLFRDLRATWAQALAIAMVIAGGVATFVMSTSTLHSLVSTRDTYYRNYRFAQIFAQARRVPEHLRERIADIPGVDRVETRVVASVKVLIDGFPDPVKGLVVSIPDNGQPELNRLHIRAGRLPDPDRDDEVVLNEVFAEAHGFQVGDELDLVIRGRLERMRVVAIALSPEFVFQINPGSVIPDFRRYGVMWMARNVLEAAWDMDGAFNDLSLTLTAGGNAEEVMTRVDRLLEPYGGLDAQDRYWQTSHRFLENEFSQLEQMARIFSTIFLGVAAFLLNVVLSRLISTQREQVAALKAFGYSNTDVGLHYFQYVSLIILVGLALGIGTGIQLGRGLSHLYIEYYRFPVFTYELRASVLAIAGVVSILAGTLGTWSAVRRAALLPPAEAMRPEPPARYRRSIVERLGLGRVLSQTARMIIRNLERRPLKSAFSVLGIALACAIMVVGTFFIDAVDYMIEEEFGFAQRQDMTIRFFDPTDIAAYYDVLHIPGVEYGEVFRSVPVRLRNGHLSYRTTIKGSPRERDLNRTLNVRHRVQPLPVTGVMLTDHLAKILDLEPGDTVVAEVLEGRRPVLELPVTALVNQSVGVGAYMEIDALNRLMLEGDVISGVYVKFDSARREAVFSALKEAPRVASSDAVDNMIEAFYQTSGHFILVFVGFISILSVIIAFGVVYNSARIALSERARELASMRVLGFTRGEISTILLGELALLTLLAIPAGLVIGRLLCWIMIRNVQQDIFRIPLVVEPGTYSLAALVVVVASVLSSLLVRSRLDHLDLVAVLKTQE